MVMLLSCPRVDLSRHYHRAAYGNLLGVKDSIDLIGLDLSHSNLLLVLFKTAVFDKACLMLLLENVILVLELMEL